MKTKILTLATLAAMAMVLAGCGNNSANNMPASTNSMGGQQTPNPANPGGGNSAITNNLNDTNNPATTNQ